MRVKVQVQAETEAKVEVCRDHLRRDCHGELSNSSHYVAVEICRHTFTSSHMTFAEAVVLARRTKDAFGSAQGVKLEKT